MDGAPDILDCTLRDGSYCIDFQFTEEDTALIAGTLDAAGVPRIEVGHGLGLGAFRTGGEQAASDAAYLAAGVRSAKQAAVGAFFIPGIGQDDDLRLAADAGASFIRIGSNATDFTDKQPRAIRRAKALGLEVSCNLMKSYAIAPERMGTLASEAHELGADCICVVDSAGGMTPAQVRDYVEACRAAAPIAVGFHGHDNLCLAVANSLEAARAGASVVDASLRGMGRSEGNAVTEVLAALLQAEGHCPRIDVHLLLDAAQAFIAPIYRGAPRSALGITAGRAKFHSAFMGRVAEAAAQHGVDARELILRLCERDTVNAPAALVESLAADLAREAPAPPLRIDFAAARAEAPADFGEQAAARIRELREKAKKFGLPSVLNVVATPYEMTRVSPYVETRYGCAMTNIMLAEPDGLDAVVAAADGIADYILADPGGAALSPPKRSRLLRYSDTAMWVRAAVHHVQALLGGAEAPAVLLVGIPALTELAAPAFEALGARMLSPAAPWGEADAVVTLSPRRPAVGPEEAAAMRPGALLFDGGIGSLAREAVPAAEARGVRVVRVDMRPTLAAAALELIGLQRVVAEDMGRADWEGVAVVAGGRIGQAGAVIVDSIQRPTRLIGVADGQGGILPAPPDHAGAAAVRRLIAERRLAPAQDDLH